MNIIKISDIFKNELFGISEELEYDKRLYYNEVNICNPAEVPQKPVYRDGITSADLQNYIRLENPENAKFKDGLRETGETFLDTEGNLVAFGDEACEYPYFKKNSDGKVIFSGSKFHDWGLIFLTDENKNGCYGAVYERKRNELYILPEGYELSRPDFDGNLSLFGKEKIYKASLKLRPEIMMYSYYSMLIEDEKIYSPAPAKKEGEIIKIPVFPVFNQLYCRVEINEGKAVITKQNSRLELTSGSDKAYIDGREYILKSAVTEENGILFAEADAVGEFLGITVIYDEKLNKVRFKAETAYYRKWDVEENTYMMMPFYSEDNFPEFIKKEAEESIETIKALGDGVVNLAFMTDMHYGAFDTDRMIVKKAVNAYKHIAEAVPSEGIIIGGDCINEGTKEVRNGIFRELIDHFEGTEAFFIKGNHDDGSIWDLVFTKPETHTNHFTRGELNGIFASCRPGKAVTNPKDKDGAYWYFDNEENKIRFIGLDTSDIEKELDEEGKLKFPGISYSKISGEQYEWLCNEALKLDEEGWTVLIFMHVGIQPDGDDVVAQEKNRTSYPIFQLLDAYKKKGSIKKEYNFKCGFETKLDFDFSDYKTAEIAAVICGHYHHDFEFRSEEGIPYVRTSAFCPENFGKYTHGKIRREKTAEEILFDMISVDTKNKKLYFTRVGEGKDREISY